LWIDSDIKPPDLYLSIVSLNLFFYISKLLQNKIKLLCDAIKIVIIMYRTFGSKSTIKVAQFNIPSVKLHSKTSSGLKEAKPMEIWF